MLHQLHQTYRLLGGLDPAQTQVRDARARRWVMRRLRLRGLLGFPMGVHHA
jgi:hypothetical protein